jgi:hypothetical protein
MSGVQKTPMQASPQIVETACGREALLCVQKINVFRTGAQLNGEHCPNRS